jgi:hypothetical protein
MILPAIFSCSAGKFGGYTLNQQDAAAAIRQYLEMGVREGVNGTFTRELVMNKFFPEPVRKTLNTLQQLGVTDEIDRFVNTLSVASEKAAQSSMPVFISSINNLSFTDAMRIIRDGGTSGTDYLRSSVGADLRKAITPAVESALKEYKLEEQWEKIIKPAQSVVGNRLNFDLGNLMAGMVSEAMFQKIEEKEKEVRANASARTTTLLQKVFSRNW